LSLRPTRRKRSGLILPPSLCLATALLLASTPLAAGGQTLHQLYHRSWTVREGAPSTITSIAQTADGFLWLGTDNGLVRFDGDSFEPYHPSTGGDLLSSYITVVTAMADGGLWIGYQSGDVSFLQNGHITNFTRDQGLSAGSVHAFAKDMQGRVWAATSYGLNRLEGSQWHDVGPHGSYPEEHPDNVFVDSRGTLWANTKMGLVFLPKGRENLQVANSFVFENVDIEEAPNGAVWMAASNGSVRAITTPDGIYKANGASIDVNSDGIYFAKDGALWISTIGKGLLRVPYPDSLVGTHSPLDRAVERFSERDGLTSNFGFRVIEDREGSVWVATTRGIDQFRKSVLTPVKLPQGAATYIALVADGAGGLLVGSDRLMRVAHGSGEIIDGAPRHVECAYRDQSGVIWLGGRNGLWHVSGTRFISTALPHGLDPLAHKVQAITMDRAGALWVSFVNSGVFRLNHNMWSRFGSVADLPQIPAVTELTDSAGRIWFGYTANRIALLDGTRISMFGLSDGLDIGNVISIYEHDGEIWTGGQSGLELFERGHFRHLQLAGSEPLRAVSGIVLAKNGDLWVNQASGVVHIAADEVAHARKDPQYQVRYELLNYLDGLISSPEQLRPLPTAVESSDGRIYFATRGGVVWVEPANIARNILPPPVWIRSVSVDNKLYNDLETLEFPAHAQNIEINYTAPSLLIPQRVHFRYKLEGFDKDWRDAGVRRQAFYSKLPPRTYTFRVTASNNDGVWNEAGASFAFSIPPSFTQSVLFKALCAITILGLSWLLYTVRLRQLTGQVRARLYERLAERTRIARELHDTLLQSFQGLLLHFQRARNLLPERAEEAIQTLDRALDGAEQAIVEGRDAIHDLRSPAPAAKGLVEEITSLGEELVAKNDNNDNKDAAQFRAVIEGNAQALNPNVHVEIFRIAREALRNAFSHSQARRIETEVAYSSNLFRLRIRDDGKGMAPDVRNRGERIGHWGLGGMRERAKRLGGELEVWSEPGAGTEVDLRVPASIAYQSCPARNNVWLFWKKKKNDHEDHS
jgi:signal transduction histidine kinase/ligand-binding sensor domain-containing protein